MRSMVLAAAGLAGIFGPQMAGASPFDEVRIGAVSQGLGPFSPNKEDGVGINGELLFRSVVNSVPGGSLRPHAGITVATGENATSQIYAGLTWEQRFARRFFLDAGVGVAVHDGETDFDPFDPDFLDKSYLGCRALFRLSAGLGYMVTDRVSASVHVDHISNADICDENEGLDNTGVRLGYRF